MKGYNRTYLKLSFDKENTHFYVNEKKKTVVCMVNSFLNTPYNPQSPVDVYGKYFKGIGVAKCHGEDIFDVERGKRIALTKAEDNAYANALKYLGEQRKYLVEMMFMIDSFSNKANHQFEHNHDYIESVSNINHERYKSEVLPVKRGVTHIVKE